MSRGTSTSGKQRKETRLQGLNDRLAVSDDPEAEVLRQEVDRLEQEIKELTEFSPGSAFGDSAERIADMDQFQFFGP